MVMAGFVRHKHTHVTFLDFDGTWNVLLGKCLGKDPVLVKLQYSYSGRCLGYSMFMIFFFFPLTGLLRVFCKSRTWHSCMSSFPVLIAPQPLSVWQESIPAYMPKPELSCSGCHRRHQHGYGCEMCWPVLGTRMAGSGGGGSWGALMFLFLTLPDTVSTSDPCSFLWSPLWMPPLHAWLQ